MSSRGDQLLRDLPLLNLWKLDCIDLKTNDEVNYGWSRIIRRGVPRLHDLSDIHGSMSHGGGTPHRQPVPENGEEMSPENRHSSHVASPAKYGPPK